MFDGMCKDGKVPVPDGSPQDGMPRPGYAFVRKAGLRHTRWERWPGAGTAQRAREASPSRSQNFTTVALLRTRPSRPSYLCRPVARPMMRRRAILPLLLLLLLASCSEFNKALKSTDLDYKLRAAEKYYEAKSYERAIPLLEELIALCRGSACSERVNYLHAKACFGMKDYTMAAYYLANFTRTFPKSAFAEDAAFLSAYCHYKNSPAYALDQGETRSAIDQMQLFMVRYPNTTLRDSCNMLIDQLRGKLETKAFKSAFQYYHMRNFQAAGVAFRSFVRDWPNSRHREEAMLLTLRADHHLAINSVESKKQERLNAAIRSFHNFADAFPQSLWINEAVKLHKELDAALAQETNPPGR